MDLRIKTSKRRVCIYTVTSHNQIVPNSRCKGNFVSALFISIDQFDSLDFDSTDSASAAELEVAVSADKHEEGASASETSADVADGRCILLLLGRR